jgi:hypothetical protein
MCQALQYGPITKIDGHSCNILIKNKSQDNDFSGTHHSDTMMDFTRDGENNPKNERRVLG